jgi:hypothetical protein
MFFFLGRFKLGPMLKVSCGKTRKQGKTALPEDDERLLQVLQDLGRPFERGAVDGEAACIPDRRGRSFPDAFAEPTARPQQPTKSPSKSTRQAIPRHEAKVFRRLLLPLWCEALASGEKWIEVQRYSGKSLHQLKFADEGKLMVFGPSGAAFGEVHGLAVLASSAHVNRPVSDGPACLPGMGKHLHTPFLKYLEGCCCFDSMQIAQVYDLRDRKVTWQQLATMLETTLPKQTQGFPSVGGEHCRSQLLKLFGDAKQHRR